MIQVQLDKVAKRYRFEWIFKGLNEQFYSGKRYAIQGPNGSGKSTLLKLLSGHLSPSKGKILFTLNDKILSGNDVYRHLSFAAPYIDLIEELTLTEAIRFHSSFKYFQGNQKESQIIDILGFQKSKHKEIRYFSSGMKQRLKLALALCSQTEILLLDEPTTNLDEQGIRWYRELIQQYTKDRLLIIASNAAVDFDFCEESINMLDYK